MGNCLVTKLKGSVDNPYLPKLGELMIKVTPRETPHPNGNYLRIAASSAVTLYSADGSNVFYVDSPSNLINTTSGTDISIRILNTACTLMVTNKAAIVAIYAYEGEKGFDLSSIAPYNAIATLDLTRNEAVSGDISVLKNTTSLRLLNISGCRSITGTLNDLPLSLTQISTDIEGNIAVFNDNPNIENVHLRAVEGSIDSLSNIPRLSVIDLVDSKVTGNIMNLSKFTAIINVGLSAYMEGSVESLVEGLCAAGRANGELTIGCPSSYNSKVTINGIIIPASNYTKVTFTNTGATTSDFGGGRTYDKSTGTWS